MSSRLTGLGLGLRDSLSIAMGYFPVAVSFGLAAVQAHFSPFMAVLISLTVYAGASQFVLTSLVAAGAGAFSVITTVWIMNIRHLFYGPSLLEKLGTLKNRLPLPALAWGLTDEVYAASMGRISHIPEVQRQGWYMGMQLGAYSAWVGGTVVGAVLGGSLGEQAQWVRDTLDFVLPALFVALLLEMLRHAKLRVTVAAMLASGLALLVLPGHVAMLLGLIAGAALGAYAATKEAV